MIELDERQRDIELNTAKLLSRDAKERRNAAYWLGEAAVAEAIPRLVAIYENDPDSSVRKAAAYALGMFRAVEQNLEKGKEEKVVKLLQQVEDEGRLGKRASKGKWVTWIIFLLLLLAGLAAAYLILPAPSPEGEDSTSIALATDEADPQTEINSARSETITELRSRVSALRGDATTLVTQFQSVLGGGALDCEANFRETSAFPVEEASAFSDLVPIVERFNSAQSIFAELLARFRSACDGTNPLTPEEVGPMFAQLNQNVVIPLPEIGAALIVAEAVGQATPIPPTAESTEVPATSTPTVPTETPVPTTELVITDPSRHLPVLYGIIDDMTATRGATQLLIQYWSDLRESGTLSGACSSPLPAIPENYTLPSQDAVASDALRQAVDMINSGLNLTRSGWAAFMNACQSSNPLQNYQVEYTSVQNALINFNNASSLLGFVRR